MQSLEEVRARKSAYQRKWQIANPEKVRATQRNKYLARREELIERARVYARANKEKIKAYQRAYAASPEGKAARANAEHKRRAKKNACESRATKAQVKKILSSAVHCNYCKAPFDLFRRPTLDHVVPLSKGGPHCLSNLVAACLPCNLEKGAKLNFKKRKERVRP